VWIGSEKVRYWVSLTGAVCNGEGPEKGQFKMVEIKCVTFALERGAYFIPSGFVIATSMTCSRRNLLPISCYWDGAQSLLPPWCIPSIWFLWPGCWCPETGYGDPGLCCAWLQMTCQDTAAWCTSGAFDPVLNGMPSLTNIDLTTFTGDAVDTSCFQAKVILDGLKETGDLPRWETYSFYVMSH
jgi:hypothetical protein